MFVGTNDTSKQAASITIDMSHLTSPPTRMPGIPLQVRPVGPGYGQGMYYPMQMAGHDVSQYPYQPQNPGKGYSVFT